MNPLILAIAVLTLLSLITGGSIKRAVDRTSSHHLLVGGLEASRVARNGFERQLYLIEISTRASSKGAGSVPDGVKSASKGTGTGKKHKKKYWAPLYTRLNLNNLLEDKRSQKQGQGDPMVFDDNPWVAITAGLMRQLYGQCDWFQEVQKVEYLIIEQLRLQCQRNEHGITRYGFHGKLELTDHLAAIPMESPEVQQVWLKMVLGGPRHPSFLDWVELSNQKRINLVLAPEELLTAIFSNPKDVDNIIAIRDAALDDFMTTLEEDPDNADGTLVIEAVKSAVATADSVDRYEKMFDYTLKSQPDQVSVPGDDKRTGIQATYRFHTPPKSQPSK